MKTRKMMLAMTALTCGIASMFTSCSSNDNPVTPQKRSFVISFEGQATNSDGYWIGEVNDKGYDNGYGTSYPCTYTEQGMTFNTTYSVYYWSGYAISSRTSTELGDAYTPNQYNNVTGTAHTGRNFCVVQTYGETISLAKPATIKSLYYTNSMYAVNSILNGDSYSGPKFDATDWLKCTIQGTHADGTTASVDIDLAKDGSYVQTWMKADLSALGKVNQLSFAFSGSRNNDWGLLTPAYICIDDIEIEVTE